MKDIPKAGEVTDLTVSASAIANFQGCQQRWAYSYIDKIQPKHRDIALSRGDVIHRCVQAHWRKESMIPILESWRKASLAELMPHEHEAFEAEVVKVVDIMGRYRKTYGPPKDDIVVVSTEFELSARLKRGLRLLGYVDILAAWGGQLWAIEIKTARNLKARMAYLGVDPQVTAYLWALREHGMNVAGVLWDGINTFPYKDRSKEPDSKLFRRVTVFRSDEQLNTFARDTCLVADDIARVKKRQKFVRNLGPGCARCPFKGPCHARVEGDLRKEAALLRTDYEKKEYRQVG